MGAGGGGKRMKREEKWRRGGELEIRRGEVVRCEAYSVNSGRRAGFQLVLIR